MAQGNTLAIPNNMTQYNKTDKASLETLSVNYTYYQECIYRQLILLYILFYMSITYPACSLAAAELALLLTAYCNTYDNYMLTNCTSAIIPY